MTQVFPYQVFPYQVFPYQFLGSRQSGRGIESAQAVTIRGRMDPVVAGFAVHWSRCAPRGAGG